MSAPFIFNFSKFVWDLSFSIEHVSHRLPDTVKAHIQTLSSLDDNNETKEIYSILAWTDGCSKCLSNCLFFIPVGLGWVGIT